MKKYTRTRSILYCAVTILTVYLIIQALDGRDVESINVDEEIEHLKKLAQVGERLMPEAQTSSESEKILTASQFGE